MLLKNNQQNINCDAWKHLLESVYIIAQQQLEELNLTTIMKNRDDKEKIITLPSSISKLTSVKRLHLYGSALVRIPPEVGDMIALEEFTLYTSYNLHWFPYEITRCTRLRESTVSTRAIYGNHKNRMSFPSLKSSKNAYALQLSKPKSCSVCNQPFIENQFHVRWISLGVATDVLPLLVYACSLECVEALPQPPKHYVSHPHLGGSSLQQPPKGF